MEHIKNNLVWSLLDKHLSSDRRDAIAVRAETEVITYQELSQQVMRFMEQHPTDLAPKNRTPC